MKIIIALLLASDVSAFGVPKTFLGSIGGIATAKYDPKIFELEGASVAKDASPIEQGGERRLQFIQNYPSSCSYWGVLSDTACHGQGYEPGARCDAECKNPMPVHARIMSPKSAFGTWFVKCSAQPKDGMRMMNLFEGPPPWDEDPCLGCEECKCLKNEYSAHTSPYYQEDRFNRYMLDGVCTVCPIDNLCNGIETSEPSATPACPDECVTGSGCDEECKCLADPEQRYSRYMLNGVCTACPLENSCDGLSTWSTPACPQKCKGCKSDRTCDGSESVVDGRCQDFCSINGYCGTTAAHQIDGLDCTPCRSTAPDAADASDASDASDADAPTATPSDAPTATPSDAPTATGCDDACKPGGTYTGPGDPAGCTEAYCDLYAPGGYFRYRCDPANAHYHYALGECAKTCGICTNSGGSKNDGKQGSVVIIIPVVIAAVLLVAAVLYLVRKRRVAAATPDETPQLDTEVQIEG